MILLGLVVSSGDFVVLFLDLYFRGHKNTYLLWTGFKDIWNYLDCNNTVILPTKIEKTRKQSKIHYKFLSIFIILV